MMPAKLMSAAVLALVVAVSAGCQSSVKFTVEQFTRNDEVAKAAYREAHGEPVPQGTSQVVKNIQSAHDAVKEFRETVKYSTWIALSVAAGGLSAGTKGNRPTAEEKKNDANKAWESLNKDSSSDSAVNGITLSGKRTSDLRKLFEGYDAAYKRFADKEPQTLEEAQVTALVLLGQFRLAVDALKKAAWETDPAELKANLDKLDDQGLVKHVWDKLAQGEFRQALSKQQVETLFQQDSASLNEPAKLLPRSLERSLRIVAQKLDAEGWYNRNYLVYQDATDKYLLFVNKAENASYWTAIPNSAAASGDGDASYVLVFDQLDASWKRVAIDPTKVIAARLRILRKVANTLIAAAGIATMPFGVPLPKMSGDNANGPLDMDYSAMTGQTEYEEKMNAKMTKRIKAVLERAEELERDLNSDKANKDTRLKVLRDLNGLLDGFKK